jgi:hypothetical protein
MESIPTDGQTTHPWTPRETTTRITKMRKWRDKEIISTSSCKNLAWERNISIDFENEKGTRATRGAEFNPPFLYDDRDQTIRLFIKRCSEVVTACSLKKKRQSIRMGGEKRR